MRIGRPKLGIALGSGGARGWVHVGILRALADEGVYPDIVTGCSAGAVVGAFYAANRLDRLEDFARLQKSFRTTTRYMDFSFSNPAIIGGRKFIEFLEEFLTIRDFADLDRPFGAVAVNLVNGEEVHMSAGALMPAIRASVSVPGFIAPHESERLQLVDGGVLNPVPVNLARKLGADAVIGVDLNTAPMEERKMDSITGVLNRTIDVMTNRVRLDNRYFFPADLWLEPKMNNVGFFDLHRFEDAAEIGRDIVEANLDEVRKLTEHHVITGDRMVRIPDILNRAFSGIAFRKNVDYEASDEEPVETATEEQE